MATDLEKARSIKYLGKDFSGFKRDLVKFTQAHWSGTYSDMNETSPGMMLLEQGAYVGDVLAQYIDHNFNELKMERARQLKNVVSFARSLGYRAKGKRAAVGEANVIVEVPATTDARGETIPDDTYSPTLRAGARLDGPNGVAFETLDPVDFSSSLGRFVTGSEFNATTGLPTNFALMKAVRITAGKTQTQTVAITDFVPFKTVELTQEDVLEVLSVVDSDGNDWYEVDFLAQDTVFDSDANPDDDSDVVPYVLKLRSVPRRFITERDPTTNKTSLVFGSGEGVDFDDILVPNLADLAIPLPGRNVFTSVALDPQNFLKTRSLGLSPYDTTLSIKYRTGGGLQTNVPPKSIKTVSEAVLDFNSTNLDTAKKGNVEGSLQCINLKKTDGGGPEEGISEIKANAGAFFAAQNRIVTREDIHSRVMSIPEKFGKPDKAFVKWNNTNSLSLDLHVLTRDANGHLAVASSALKENIKTYLSKFRMMTDAINILDADIIDIGVKFGVVVSSKYNRSEVLVRCLDAVRSYFAIDKQQIGQPIVMSDLSAELQDVDGVISVFELSINNVFGAAAGFEYSATRFDARAATKNGIVYCPEDAIFEVRHPRRDIVGVAK